MNILENPQLILFIAILLGLIIVYLVYQLKIKKSKGKSLDKELELLNMQVSSQISELALTEEKLKKLKLEKDYLIDLEEREESLRSNESALKVSIEQLNIAIEAANITTQEKEDYLLSIKNQISIYQPIIDFANLGFFEEPEYLFETSERYKAEIKVLRDEQKEFIKNNDAILFPETIAMTDNKAYVKRILSGQAKLMLKAFNTECDLLMGLIKSSNFSKTLERINKLATDLEKNSVALKCSFNIKYIELKYKECELQYQYKLKYEEEREEQAIIREQIREEQKALKEFERAIAAAEKEERIYRNALEKAKNQLELASDDKKAELESKIALLEIQLKEAEEKEQRAKSLAEQTRKGHVYIISNIGSFGENIYKIGLTRRLEPLDRVKELGDASVPFPFDVHAMIYSEDAPALETQLHKEFSYMRVNKVNRRKEFFSVELSDIKEKVIDITGTEQNFKMTAVAENYYESLKLSSLNKN